MKKIKETLLHYRQGASDKVYNVYLYETKEGFLVNFEYGRFGANLRSGSKTSTPVTLKEAEKIFDSLVSQKMKKGYKLEDGFDPKRGENKKEYCKISKEEYLKILLERLQRAEKESLNIVDNYRLSRLIFRAGELRFTEAKETILAILNKNIEKDNSFYYSVLFFLGRVGQEDDIFTLKKLEENLSKNSKYIANLAVELIKKDNNKKLERQIFEEIDELEKEELKLRETLKRTEKERPEWGVLSFWDLISQHTKKLSKIREEIDRVESKKMDILIKLYALKDGNKKIIEYITKDKEIDIFKTKKIYKASYFMDDFKSLAKISTELFAREYYHKNYFKRRGLRTLKLFGEFEPESYLKLSKEILLSLNGYEESFKARERVYYRYNYKTDKYRKLKCKFDAFAYHTPATFIMKGNSKYLELDKYKKFWSRVKDSEYKIEDIPFVDIWRENIDVVLEILAKSEVNDVRFFAIKIIKENPEALARVDVKTLVKLLNIDDSEIRDIIFSTLKEQYKKEKNIEIIKGFLLSGISEISDYGVELLEKDRDFLKIDGFFVDILEGSSKSVFKKSLDILGSLEDLEDVASELVSLLKDSKKLAEKDKRERVKKSLEALKSYVKIEDLEPILNQDEIDESLLTALWLVRVGDFDISTEIKNKIAKLNHPEVTTTMVFLLGKLDDETLAKESKTLIYYLFDADSKVRAEAKKLIKRVAVIDAKNLLNLITQRSFKSSDIELEKDILIAVNYLKSEFKNFSTDTLYRLVTAKSRLANQIGVVILESKKFDEFSPIQWINFAKNRNRKAREWAFSAFKSNRKTIEEIMPKPLDIFYTNWQDSREFAIDYFLDFELSLDEIVIIADSNYQDAQNFAKGLILSTGEDSRKILYRLSQHPSKNLQKFIVSLTSKEATNSELLELEQFFHTILLSINSNREAKDIILEILNSKIETREIANLYAKLLRRHYRSFIDRDREDFFEAMYRIKSNFDDIDLPIEIIDDVEVKDAV